MITSIRSKDLFGFFANSIAIRDDVQAGFHVGEKCEGSLKIAPVSEERDALADDVPCGAKSPFGRGRFSHEDACSGMVDIFRIKAGVEERCVAKYAGGTAH